MAAAAADEFSKPPNLPPYSEMILAAISALDDKNGSNKTAISKYIETTYGELPPAHSSLLAAQLARMKDSGELLMLKNNYLRPGPDALPKRGRGRPPKPKPELPEGHVPPTPRPRGRPPKDPLSADKAPAAAPSGRGRPPKKARSGDAPAKAAANTVAAPLPVGSVKRGRGRPPKVKAPVADIAA